MMHVLSRIVFDAPNKINRYLRQDKLPTINIKNKCLEMVCVYKFFSELQEQFFFKDQKKPLKKKRKREKRKQSKFRIFPFAIVFSQSI